MRKYTIDIFFLLKKRKQTSKIREFFDKVYKERLKKNYTIFCIEKN